MSTEATAGSLHPSTFAWPRRPMTADERARLVQQASLGPGKVAWALAPLVVAAVVGVVVAQLSHWGIEVFAAAEDAHLAATFAVVALAVLGAVVSFVMLLSYREASRPYREDARARTVELVEAVVSRAVELGSPAAPAYLLEVGRGQLLFVCGGWLLDRAVFGGHEVAFPSTRFTLTRAPLSGAVLGVETSGEPLAAERYELPASAAGSPVVTTRDSEIIEGSIEQVLAASGATRQAAP